jgi:hypothetical protein
LIAEQQVEARLRRRALDDEADLADRNLGAT